MKRSLGIKSITCIVSTLYVAVHASFLPLGGCGNNSSDSNRQPSNDTALSDITTPPVVNGDSSNAIKLFRFEEGSLYGYEDVDGNTVIQPKYINASPFFSEGAATVLVEGGYGFINTEGNYILPPRYRAARQFHDGLAAVMPRGGNQYGYIDKTGRYVIPPQFDTVTDFYEGKAEVGKKTPASRLISKFADVGIEVDWYWIDRMGNIVDDTSKALTPFEANEQWGYKNQKGEVRIEAQWELAAEFQEKRAAVFNGNNWGFIDEIGNIIIEPVYAAVRSFKEGRAAVLILEDGTPKWGYIDTSGEMIISPHFEFASDFENGYARVHIAKKERFINRSGEYVAIPERNSE